MRRRRMVFSPLERRAFPGQTPLHRRNEANSSCSWRWCRTPMYVHPLRNGRYGRVRGPAYERTPVRLYDSMKYGRGPDVWGTTSLPKRLKTMTARMLLAAPLFALFAGCAHD